MTDFQRPELPEWPEQPDIAATPATIRAVAAALGRARLYDDKLGGSDQGRIAAWAEVVDQYDLDQDDLLAGVTAYYASNLDGRTMQVADLLKHARIIRADRLDRDKMTNLGGASRSHGDEHYPGDPGEYPREWDSDQRVLTYWYAIRMHAMPATTAGWYALAEQRAAAEAKRNRPESDSKPPKCPSGVSGPEAPISGGRS